ncbi:dTMP kinase [Aeromicrobium chenweiae]|uniref:Thymidylate kinase n=1 Tax=Aeromicrobium chenweiae TaxID=2079793 RepID=A0A2S0WI41_9ACTN|nr:dTMP kinase [Aeromicrobium chenweiae]AWB91016.1 dTMP kinase [Aeromicrobium chenweiae]TGN31920.1 dTMP kinase [Aeromicrobium chenweiae]
MDPLFTDTGVFLALEGGEGAGKSTQAALLVQWLEGLGHDVLLTREPGGTDVGTILRRIVLDNSTGELSPRTEALIYAADKAEHVDRVVLPALSAGSIVLTDRYVDSTLAYQGAGRDLDFAELESVARWATSNLRPHLTIVLDIDPTIGHARFEGADRMESEPLEFHQRVRQHFLDLAAADPAHYLVVTGGGTPEEIHRTIREAVEPWLKQVDR